MIDGGAVDEGADTDARAEVDEEPTEGRDSAGLMCECECSIEEERVKGGSVGGLAGTRKGSGEGRERMLEIWLSKA